MNKSTKTRYGSIREIAREGIIPEYRLRLLVKQGKVPYIPAGNKVLIDKETLPAILEAISREGMESNL